MGALTHAPHTWDMRATHAQPGPAAPLDLQASQLHAKDEGGLGPARQSPFGEYVCVHDTACHLAHAQALASGRQYLMLFTT